MQESYVPPPTPPGAGKVLGGLRLAICDTMHIDPGMCISREAFELIERKFRLHPATILAAFKLGGVMYCSAAEEASTSETRCVRLVIKAHQKVEIGNYLLSLTHDLESGWTDAFICGYGAVSDRPIHKQYGSLLEQLVDAILACPDWWNNPLLLPCIMHHNCVSRLDKRSQVMTQELLALELTLGVTYYETEYRPKNYRDRWREDVNPKVTTVELHTVAAYLTYLNGACTWVRELGAFLLLQEQHLRREKAFKVQLRTFFEIRENISFASSLAEGLALRFKIYQERSHLQVNVLFSIISQQNSALNRLDSRLNMLIASSSKQDSISMTTFTFITALFLPGTFIAAIFSMSMFDWQNSSDGSASAGSDSDVAQAFWIFWASAIPLTIVTMVGWYLWSKYATREWLQALKTATSTEQGPPLLLSSLYNLPSFLEKSSSRGQ